MEITAGETHEGKYYHGYKFIESCVKLLLGVFYEPSLFSVIVDFGF